MARSLIAGLILTLGVCLPAEARKPDIRFSFTADLNSLGLRIRVMPDAVETPAASPAVMTYRVTDPKGETRTLECYLPAELWRRCQFAGAWTDADGNRLVMAAMRTLPLTDLPRPQVTQEEFDTAMRRADTLKPDDAAAALTAWVAAFTGHSGITPTVATRPPARIKKLITFAFDGRPTEWACAFRAQTSAYVSVGSAPAWIFAWVTANPAITATDLAAAVNEQFLPYLSVSSRSPRENDNPSPVFQNRRTSVVGNESDEHAASRKQVIDSIRNLGDWWYAETPNFILLSNLDRKHRDVIRELQQSIEKWRSAYAAVIPPSQPVQAVGVVRILATDAEYEAYVGRDQAWTSGLWIGARKELVIRPLDGPQTVQKDRFLGVIAHEAFHQYITYALNYIQPAPWFNEGHAALFESSDIVQGKVRIEESPAYAPVIESLAKGKAFSVLPVLRMSYPQFYSGDRTALRDHYALAYALVYYLHKSAARNPKSPFRDALASYVRALEAQKDPALATAAVFSKANGAALDADMADFWTSASRRRAAKQQPLIPLR
jgi:hypothetical protein